MRLLSVKILCKLYRRDDFKKVRRGYICGSYNKHRSKACSDHHVIETELESAILSDFENMFKEAKAEDFFVLAEEKNQKQFY